MELYTINIKGDNQTVSEAIAQFLIEIEALKKGGYKVLKVIHGYGSHGVGGDIKREFLKQCESLKRRHIIEDYINCENWANKSVVKKIAINYCPDLIADRDLTFVNPGCTIVIR